MSESLKKEYEKIKDYVELTPTYNVRPLIVMVLFFLNIMPIIPLIADPFLQGDKFSILIFKICVPIIIMLDLWSIRILINPKKRRKESELCFGFLCLGASFVLQLASIKIVYIETLYVPVFFFIFSIVVYIAVFLTEFLLLLKLLKNGHFGKEERVVFTGGNYKIAGTAAVLGPVIARIIARIFNPEIEAFFTALVIQCMANFLVLGVPSIYRYFLIKKYEKFVDMDDYETN